MDNVVVILVGHLPTMAQHVLSVLQASSYQVPEIVKVFLHFFSYYRMDSDKHQQVCQLGCTQCADGSGDCTTCKSGFSQDANDRTRCVKVATRTNPGGVLCPDGSFASGTQCSKCSPSCSTCTGPTSNDCTQ